MIVNTTVGSVKLKIDTKEIDKNFNKAQVYLDNRVLMDSSAFTPKRTNVLRASGIRHTRLGSGTVCWSTPYAHYQYVGELYLTADGRSWANSGEKKYPTGTELKYHTPGTGKRWFETAKENHGKQWIDLVKREVGKG